jgi:hypothetical protein
MTKEQKIQIANELRKKTDELNALVKQAKESGLAVSIFAPYLVANQEAQIITVKVTEKTEY